MKWSYEKKFEGFFRGGKFEGLGRMVVKDRNMYLGEWKEGHPHGIGMCKKVGHEKIKGEFINGRFKQNVEGVDEILQEFVDFLIKEKEEDGDRELQAKNCGGDEVDKKKGLSRMLSGFSGSYGYHKLKESLMKSRLELSQESGEGDEYGDNSWLYGEEKKGDKEISKKDNTFKILNEEDYHSRKVDDSPMFYISGGSGLKNIKGHYMDNNNSNNEKSTIKKDSRVVITDNNKIETPSVSAYKNIIQTR